jgi:hypothetical protein
LATDEAAVTAAKGGITTGTTILGVAGTLNMGLYTLISGVVSASYVVTGNDNYAGGAAGTYPTSATTAASQLAADEAAVAAVAAGILNNVTVLGTTGTVNLPVDEAAAAGAQLAADQATVAAAAGSIVNTATILRTRGTLNPLTIAVTAENNAVIPVGKLTPVPLYAYRGTSPGWTLALLDQAGNPIDLTAKSLAMVFCDRYPPRRTVASLSNPSGGLIISEPASGQIAVALPGSLTAWPKSYEWAIRDASDSSVLAVGTLEVAFAPEPS